MFLTARDPVWPNAFALFLATQARPYPDTFESNPSMTSPYNSAITHTCRLDGISGENLIYDRNEAAVVQRPSKFPLEGILTSGL